MKKKSLLWLGAFLILIVIVSSTYLLMTGVDNRVTDEDVEYIKKILEIDEIEPVGEEDFEEKVAFISTVQDSVLQTVPHEGGVPFGQTREPKDIYYHESGSCYDRSRLLEKIFRAHGLEAVHISIYYTHERSWPMALITPGSSSHATSKIKTSQGWLAVDSNRRWLNLTEDMQTVPLSELAALEGEQGLKIEWHPKYAEVYEHGIVKRPFVYFYGLYSRHGLFYPPFDRVPDVHWGEVLYNL